MQIQRAFPIIALLFIYGSLTFAQPIKPDETRVFKTTSQGELSLDLFYPEGQKSGADRPAIVFFFGGGWVGGTPAQFYQQCVYFASRGMVAISAEYRVAAKHKTSPVECVKDGKSAIRWVRQHAKELGIDPERIVASGGSAGGHVACCTALIDGMEEENEDLTISSVPNAMILFNPVLDTTEKGYGSKKVKGYETDLSPCHNVKKDRPPSILFHGTADTTVPFENAQRFTRLMQQAGNDCRLFPAQDQKHGAFNGSAFRPKNGDNWFNMTVYESDLFLNRLGFLKGAPTIQPFPGIQSKVQNYNCYTPVFPASAQTHDEYEAKVHILTSSQLMTEKPLIWRNKTMSALSPADKTLLDNGYAIGFLSVKKQALPVLSAHYHEMRGGLKNSMIKFTRNKQGRVAFLGGSITFNQGWRDSICVYLQKRFPDTQFDFVPAGIPSMGSTSGAFRLERDVLSKGTIDLLFVEAAVNDASIGTTSLEHIRGMEGIIRHARNANPAVDIVMMHFVDPGKMKTYREGKTPEVIQNHNKVAKHYNISTINLAKEVTDRIDAGEFTWEDDFKNLHPSPFGQGVYARSMISFLDNAWKGYVADDDKITLSPQPDPIDPYSYSNGQLITAAEKIKPAKGWHVDQNWNPNDKKRTRPNYVKVPMLIGVGESGWIKLEFEGNAVGIAVAAGPDAGIVEYKMDGGKIQKLDLFTRWSSQLHLPRYFTLCAGLANKKHTLKLRVSDNNDPKNQKNACRIRYFYINKEEI
ncbi:alpha/beta hydrolase fold domain-containing protein [Thermophagus sp. OGC60D27]|uniref:alpha/beta hydrolase fold domain-containing protein n=1 Tax=Thermophagus sp. OGC60D27 TaxID=3458415 RepID=UPI00403789AF